MDEMAWMQYQKIVKKAEEMKQCIIDLYGAYNANTVFKARHDGLIDDQDYWTLRHHCPY